jgi:glutamyl-tRNA synthetase/glutamyl-Q tRNA(Asp) synthetase
LTDTFPPTPLPAGDLRGRLTRFAPAPTGWLHLGHVLNALYVWNTARACGGRVLLRIEDHDRQRARAEYEAGILDDLDWLGFEPDVHPTTAFRAGRCAGRQSDREEVYRDALDRLIRDGRIYACDCSRRQLDSPVRRGAEHRYPGTCRTRGLRAEDGIALRVVLDDTTERFADGLLGPQEQRPAAQCGDMLVRDRLGNWTYQFAVTVDDWRQGIDLVIRGLDLLESTGRQIQLARLLGRAAPPVFAHHPLIMRSPGQKLSKSDGDTGIRELRARGLSKEEVLTMALDNFQPPTPNSQGEPGETAG